MPKPSDRLTQAFSQQIGNELAASIQYIAIGNYFSAETLPELARLFYRQANEERDHAMKFVRYLIDVGAPVVIPAIAAPKHEFRSAEECVLLSLEWEEEVTEQITSLVALARQEDDYLAQRFLDWFLSEQLEEVATMSSLLQVVRRAGEAGLLHVEEYLARKGVSAAPAPGA
jgi:bacterioferritin B